MITHVADRFAGNGEADRTRIARAQETWRGQTNGYRQRFLDSEGARNATVLGSTRKLPFLHDVIDCAGDLTTDNLIILTNADTGLVCDWEDHIPFRIMDGVKWANRRDWSRRARGVDFETNKRLGKPSAGIDLVAFDWKWWDSKGRFEIPDLVLGCEGWDWIFKFSGNRIDDIIFHETHEIPIWFQNRKEIANRYNRMLCHEWASARPDYARLTVEWPALLQFAAEYSDSKKEITYVK